MCKAIIIGTGPSGSIAGALLQNRGYQVTIPERQRFPRLNIDESLPPQCMEFIQQADTMDAAINAAFQFKNDASFVCRNLRMEFSFEDKFTDGIGTMFQVRRGILADDAAGMGIDKRWELQDAGYITPQVLSVNGDLC